MDIRDVANDEIIIIVLSKNMIRYFK